jgi:hypothetical protein
VVILALHFLSVIYPESSHASDQFLGISGVICVPQLGRRLWHYDLHRQQEKLNITWTNSNFCVIICFMETVEREGRRVVEVSGMSELGAVRTIVTAFSRYARAELNASQDVLDAADKAADAVNLALTLSLNVRTQVPVDAETINRFGEPYIGMIQVAVAVYEQRPDVLEPFIEEDELMGARAYFPPTATQA